MVSVGILHGDFSNEAMILYRRLGYCDHVAWLKFSKADGGKSYPVHTIMGEGVLAWGRHVASILHQGRLASIFLYYPAIQKSRPTDFLLKCKEGRDPINRTSWL